MDSEKKKFYAETRKHPFLILNYRAERSQQRYYESF
jgi:hypothetical protein